MGRSVTDCDDKHRKRLKYTVYQKFIAQSRLSEHEFTSEMSSILSWDSDEHDKRVLGREVHAPYKISNHSLCCIYCMTRSVKKFPVSVYSKSFSVKF